MSDEISKVNNEIFNEKNNYATKAIANNAFKIQRGT